MQIAFNALPLLSPLTGVGNYTLQLARQFMELSPTNLYTFYYGYFARRLIVSNEAVHAAKSYLKDISYVTPTLRRFVDLASKFHRKTFDIYFEPNFIPLSIRAKRIATTVHDFTFLLYSESQPKERMDYFRRQFDRRISRSDCIITDSVYVMKEVRGFLNLPAVPIKAIHLGVDHECFTRRDSLSLNRFKSAMGLSDPFILFVGTLEPRKNVRRLLQAYLELPEQIKNEFRLVLVGGKGREDHDTSRLIEKAKNRVQYLGFLRQTELACMYNLASLFIFPSLYEGFGLPPLEAMACGCPVVVSNVASLPEICGDAAVYVDPNKTESIASGIQLVLTDEHLRSNLIERGYRRVKEFTWEKTAKETLEVFDEILRR
jgi:glycosyltransferase involved in cell wall biosynthesis